VNGKAGTNYKTASRSGPTTMYRPLCNNYFGKVRAHRRQEGGKNHISRQTRPNLRSVELQNVEPRRKSQGQITVTNRKGNPGRKTILARKEGLALQNPIIIVKKFRLKQGNSRPHTRSCPQRQSKAEGENRFVIQHGIARIKCCEPDSRGRSTSTTQKIQIPDGQSPPSFSHPGYRNGGVPRKKEKLQRQERGGGGPLKSPTYREEPSVWEKRQIQVK